MSLSELVLSCAEPYNKVSAKGRNDLRQKVERFTHHISQSAQVGHSKVIPYLIHAAHFTHFLGNPEDLKNGYIDAAVQFVSVANPPVDYLIGDEGHDMAAYLRNWLYHDPDRQFMNRFLSGLQRSLVVVFEKSPKYAKKLEALLDAEISRSKILNPKQFVL